MIHELNVQAAQYGRVTMGEVTAKVVKHSADYQTGDELHLFQVNKWGYRETHYVERDRNGRFLNEQRDNAPARVEITHVLPASQCDGLVEGMVLLSFTLLEG